MNFCEIKVFFGVEILLSLNFSRKGKRHNSRTKFESMSENISKRKPGFFIYSQSGDIILSLLAMFLITKEVDSQMFVRDCNDTLIDAHNTTYGHTYCEHVCDFPSMLVSGTLLQLSACSPGGYCTCKSECYQNDLDVKPVLPSPDLCPPLLTDPPETDPTWEGNCRYKCELECEDGIGVVCGEIMPIPVGANSIYVKLCVCVCPPKQCPQPEISNNGNSSLVFQDNISFFLLYKNPYPKIVKFILTFWKYIIVNLVIFLVFFLGLIAISMYYISFFGATFVTGQIFDSLSLIFEQLSVGILGDEGGGA